MSTSKLTIRPFAKTDKWIMGAQRFAAAEEMFASLRVFARVTDVLDFYVHEVCPDGVALPLKDVQMSGEGRGRVTLEGEVFELGRKAKAKATEGDTRATRSAATRSPVPPYRSGRGFPVL